jgi:hypothetical protein
LHNEHTAEVDHIQNAFEASLAKDRPLKRLFASFRRGLTTPEPSPGTCGAPGQLSATSKSGLMRKWAQFVNHQACAKSPDLGKKS